MSFKENNPRPTEAGELLTADSNGIPVTSAAASAYTVLTRDATQSNGLAWSAAPILLANQVLDMTSTGEKTIYTVPTGFNLIIFEMLSNISTNGLVSHPTFSIGTSGSPTRWLASSAHLTGIGSGQFAYLSRSGAPVFFGAFQGDEVVIANVTVAAVSTNYNQSFSMIGALVPSGS